MARSTPFPKRHPAIAPTPAAAKATNRTGPCFELKNGRKACGVVAHPELYSYPDGLPKPLEQDTRIVGHFHVVF